MAFEKAAVKHYFPSSLVMDTAETHPPAGGDAVEHATFQTRVTHCNFDLINVEAEIQAHRLEIHGVLYNRLEEFSPREIDSDMVEQRTCSNLEALAKAGLDSKRCPHPYSS